MAMTADCGDLVSWTSRISLVALVSLVALAGVTAPAVRAQPAPVTPAARSGAAPPVQVPQVIRPTSTLGPGVPGQPVLQSPGAVAPGQPAAGSGTSGAAAPAASAAAPRFPGMMRFQSVGKSDAVLFDAPSEKAKKIFVAPEGMPVEIVSVLRTWVKVRDPLGDLAWIHRDDLSDRRMVIASVVAPLRREPQPLAPAWFSVDRGVVLELLDEKPVNGFVRVRYADGQVGYLQPNQIWGL